MFLKEDKSLSLFLFGIFIIYHTLCRVKSL